MAKIIRKQIDLPSETLRAVKILAAMQDTNPKKYIEGLVRTHIKMNAGKIKSVDRLSLGND